MVMRLATFLKSGHEPDFINRVHIHRQFVFRDEVENFVDPPREHLHEFLRLDEVGVEVSGGQAGGESALQERGGVAAHRFVGIKFRAQRRAQ